MDLSRRLIKLGIKPDILSKLIFVSDQGADIVCALQQCIRRNSSSHMINTMLRNTFKKEFLETSLPHISLLTFEFKDATYLKQSGLVHHLKTTLAQQNIDM
jgi:hypothetical protein